MRLRKVQVVVDGREETAVAAVWVTDGMERCRVGFLHLGRHQKVDRRLRCKKICSSDLGFLLCITLVLRHCHVGAGINNALLKKGEDTVTLISVIDKLLEEKTEFFINILLSRA